MTQDVENNSKNTAYTEQIAHIEALMLEPDFWNDKEKAQSLIKELQDLKNRAEGGGPYDAGGAVLTIFSGA